MLSILPGIVSKWAPERRAKGTGNRALSRVSAKKSTVRREPLSAPGQTVYSFVTRNRSPMTDFSGTHPSGGTVKIGRGLPARPFAPANLAIAGILLVALVLRILGARGELWLDELWSLYLIDEIRARHDLLWGLAVDNNHYLNTAYLYLVGADAPVMVQRALSILLGMATVAAAGIAMRRSGRPAILCAMTLFAVLYPFVNYGSEARGYAGLILFSLLAILLAEALPDQPRLGLRLGVVNALGVLFQPVMLGGIATLMLWTAWISLPATGRILSRLHAAERSVRRAFSWTTRLLIPILAVVAFAVIHSGGYRINGTTPFTVNGFVDGYGDLLKLLLGLPEAVPSLFVLAVPPVALLLAAFRFPKQDRRFSLYVAFVLILPLAMLFARLPNIEIPRYYLAPGTAFILLLADLFASAWRAGTAWRAAALCLFAAVILGNAVELSRFIEDGRDQSAAVVREIASAGPTTVASDQDVRNQPIIEYFARRFHLPVTYIGQAERCREKPQWIVSSGGSDFRAGMIAVEEAGCRLVYRKQAYYPQWGLSGLSWTLYRRVE
jgi:hypothetical protein